MDTSIQIDESQAHTIRRLLGKARAEGIKLYRDADGRHYASSASEPGKLHFVTGYSCDCQGFARHQRCKHYAALLSALGWLETSPTPDPEPGIKIEIRHAEGHYSASGWLVGNGEAEWHEVQTSIFVNDVERIRVTGEQFNVRASWLSAKYLPSDVTCDMPVNCTHADAVRHWIEFFDTEHTVNVTTVLQNAGLFQEDAFEIEPVAA